MKYFNIASIPGDGIGPDVMHEGYKVLKALENLHGGIVFERNEFDWNCKRYLETGKMMPDDGLEILKDYDAILFGAVGAPEVPDHISVWELILPIRRAFQQYVNLRPIKLLKGIESPLRYKSVEDIDFTVIRENTEGEYSNSGGKLHENTPHETVIQNSVFTRYGTERIVKYAFEYAKQKGRSKLSVATKSNAMNYSMPFWDDIVREIAKGYPSIPFHLYHIDALAAFFVLKPEEFEVVVASNLFGDILTDLGAAIAGGIGIAPSGNINPEGTYPSMFEPIHGSAPDIAGKGIANPVAQIWSISLMLDHFGYIDLAEKVVQAIESVLVEGDNITPDLGGNASTAEMGDKIVNKILEG
ncbi:tartrate dehydrogenase [Oceanobacillus profundus]|uniref:D-malate dehydrogenase (decarboxylating) n=1 Tax=Oceanobacillus profundus TaxID=372463 RepID=A0A417YE08_9BACI|nr:tartrate dehydrogenase [Oceanobacillus profundus]MBR3120626.1 tartrate dehydrogenase [Oceanobacillus sp.]PAE28774.1 tartrate dehydrogenase [Paenibacillus sp. 7884-2]MCM3397491.1 tartrate dehydrogenase [Oceanobacillus profundus]MDO6448613.1 tartrate dehydrogenase [Oceanobacillus profundus]RHW30880.1 tartrate dehydrogenase [Oceanobacillus profundus]